jgi:hypothetical protein
MCRFHAQILAHGELKINAELALEYPSKLVIGGW